MIASDGPDSSVWSAIGWDGGNNLISSELHFERMIRHAEKLGLECPDGLSDRVFSKLIGVKPPEERNESNDQDPYLLIVKVSSEGDIILQGAINRAWPEKPLSAISLSAPVWNDGIRGTKHGDYQPYRDAREVAISNGADIGLLFEDGNLIDGDRCAPLLLDNDGVAYHPRHSDGALDSVSLQVIKPFLESSGIPVRGAKITLGMITRSSEMIVCGSGMGIKSLSTIDGRKIGNPRGRLYSLASEGWSRRLKSSKQTGEGVI